MENNVKQLQFNIITPDMRPEVEKYIAASGIQSSEYTFTTSMMWGADGKITIAFEDGVMYTCYCFPSYQRFMLAPLCLKMEDTPRAIRRAEEFMTSRNCCEHTFRGVTDANAEYFRAAGYTLIPDRDNYDYVYNMEDLRTLTGKKYHAKRNFINRLKGEHEFRFVTLGPEDMDRCMAIYRKWADGRDDSGWEETAVSVGIRHARELGLVMGGIEINGELKAFSAADKPFEDTAVVYFEKADGDIPGLYPLMNQQMVENLLNDVSFINREEDMGIEGLRKAKLSYYPARFVEKYRAKKTVD
ncbi:MAG: DUF2156 domain-containing protein [Clostridia bacterium]|nr:DUF2156 domain-containing protein [Clostridia bacterium]